VPLRHTNARSGDTAAGAGAIASKPFSSWEARAAESQVARNIFASSALTC